MREEAPHRGPRQETATNRYDWEQTWHARAQQKLYRAGGGDGLAERRGRHQCNKLQSSPEQLTLDDEVPEGGEAVDLVRPVESSTAAELLLLASAERVDDASLDIDCRCREDVARRVRGGSSLISVSSLAEAAAAEPPPGAENQHKTAGSTIDAMSRLLLLQLCTRNESVSSRSSVRQDLYCVSDRRGVVSFPQSLLLPLMHTSA